MSAILQQLWNVVTVLPLRAAHVVRRIGCGCLLALLLFLAVLVALMAILTGTVAADDTSPLGLLIYFVNDESASVNEPGGSDPLRMRSAAAAMLIRYFGLESSPAGLPVHAAALINFGSTPQLAVPPTPLDYAGRAAIADVLAAPPAPLGWTDPLAALALARAGAAADTTGRRPVVILLTDGLPEWDAAIAPPPGDNYANALRAEAAQLAELEVPLFVVLVAPETDPDPAALLWRPVWEEVAAVTPGGHVFDAVRAADLPTIYYGIAATLSGREPAAPEVVPSGDLPIKYTITVEPDLAHLKLIVLKSSADVHVDLLMPDGRMPVADGRAIRHESGALETLWAFDDPPPGEWAVVLSGPGSITIWKDAQSRPIHSTSTPAPDPTEAATLRPTAPATPTATATPVAVVAAVVSPPAAPASVEPEPSAPREPYSRLLIAGAGLVAVVLTLALRRREQRPWAFAGGLFRPLDPTAAVIDLDTLRRPRMTLGAPPADVVVPGWSARVEIAPGHAPTGDGAVVMRVLDADSDPPICVNGRPLIGEHQLRDMDVVACGPVAMRYENIHVRPDDWAAPEEDDLQVLFE